MSLLIICFGERRKLLGTEDMGLPPPLVCFLNSQNQIEYTTNSNAAKSNTEDIEEYQEEKVMSINKHKLSKNITMHCKNGALTALHSLFFLTMMWHNHLITIKHDQHISKLIKMQTKLVGFLLLHTSWTHIPSYPPCFLNQPPCIPITISWIQAHSWCVTCTPRPWLRRASTCGPEMAKYACATRSKSSEDQKFECDEYDHSNKS